MPKWIFECGCRHICRLHQAFHQPDEGQRRRPHPGRGLAEHSCFFLLHDIQGQEGPLFPLFDTPTPHCHCCLFQFRKSCIQHLSGIHQSHTSVLYGMSWSTDKALHGGAAGWLTVSACALQPRTCKNAFRATMIFHNSRHPKSLARMLDGNVVARSPTRGNDGI